MTFSYKQLIDFGIFAASYIIVLYCPFHFLFIFLRSPAFIVRETCGLRADPDTESLEKQTRKHAQEDSLVCLS